MSFQKRLQRNIAKKEKDIVKEKMKIEALKEKLDSHKITRAEFSIKKRNIEEKNQIRRETGKKGIKFFPA